jgi:hypothetical protein
LKDEFTDILDPEEKVSEIYMFSLINFALIVLVSSGVFSCVQQIKSLDLHELKPTKCIND